MEVIEINNGENKVLVEFSRFDTSTARNLIFREIKKSLDGITKEECFNEKEKLFELTFKNDDEARSFIMKFLTESEYEVSLNQKPFVKERSCKWDNSLMQSFKYPAIWIEMV
jgi:hypothetical protein